MPKKATAASAIMLNFLMKTSSYLVFY